MMKGLNGKRALVCGSTQGIGKATAERLAKEGVELILMARNGDKLKQVCNGLSTEAGQTHRYIVADFSDPETTTNSLSEILNESQPVHILINNAGGPSPGPIVDAGLNAFAEAFTIHVLMSQALVKALVNGMKDAEYGRIVNIISTSVKQPIPNLGVSNTIRGAMASWSKTMSRELASYGITVNNVLPGFTKTERLERIIELKSVTAGIPPEQMGDRMKRDVPAGRFAEASEVAAAVTFLCSEDASYINGISLPVDGGRTSAL